MNTRYFLLALCLLLQLPSWAQNRDKPLPPELMEPGAYATTVQGWIKADSVRTYSLTAEKGQGFTAQLISQDDNGSLRLLLPNGKNSLPEALRKRRIDSFDLRLPVSGRYTLEIRSHETSCSYLLEVSLLDPPKPAPPTSETFKKGRRPGSRPSSSPAEPSERPSKDDL